MQHLNRHVQNRKVVIMTEPNETKMKIYNLKDVAENIPEDER